MRAKAGIRVPRRVDGIDGKDAVVYTLDIPVATIVQRGDNVLTDPFDIRVKKTVGDIVTVYYPTLPQGVKVQAKKPSAPSYTTYDISDEVGEAEMRGGISIRLVVNGTVVDERRLDVSYSVNGLQGCMQRITEWEKGKRYRNDTGLTTTEDGQMYVDYAVKRTGAQTFDTYMCLSTHTSSDTITTDDTTRWQKMNSMFPIATPAILAQYAMLYFMQGQQILMTDESGTTINAGVSGLGQGSSGYRFFAGDSVPALAPFRVNALGEVVMTKATVTGEIMSVWPNGNPKAAMNYGGYLGESLWYENGQVMECRVHVFDSTGNVTGSEKRVYDSAGSLLWIRDRYGVYQSTNLEEYWTTLDSYYFETTSTYTTSDQLIEAMNDLSVVHVATLSQTGKMSKFHSTSGASNYGYNGYVCKGATYSGQAPTSVGVANWFTGYKAESLYALQYANGYGHRTFTRYLNGAPTNDAIDIVFKITDLTQR